MIRAIVFDIRGVLISEGNREIERDLRKKFNLEENKFRKIKFKYLNKSLTRKKRDFWFEKKISKKLKIDFDKFIYYWQKLKKKNFKINKEIFKIIKKLDKKGYLVWSLTDVNHSHDLIREDLEIYSFFKLNLKSIDLKNRKPHKKIYKILLKKIRLEPKKIIFIDDMEINLELN